MEELGHWECALESDVRTSISLSFLVIRQTKPSILAVVQRLITDPKVTGPTDKGLKAPKRSFPLCQPIALGSIVTMLTRIQPAPPYPGGPHLPRSKSLGNVHLICILVEETHRIHPETSQWRKAEWSGYEIRHFLSNPSPKINNLRGGQLYLASKGSVHSWPVMKQKIMAAGAC